MTLEKMYAICTNPISLPVAVQARKAGWNFCSNSMGMVPQNAEDCLMTIARIFHELLSRDHEDGCATWQLVPRYRGIGSEAYLNGTSQGPTSEDAREDGHMRGCSKLFMKYPG